MKENKLVMSEDGSHTLMSGVFKEHYHSTHGAIQESRHIFLQAGYHYVHQEVNEIRLLEIGFGTGLNALLTCMESRLLHSRTCYITLEPFPITEESRKSLNYPSLLEQPDAQQYFSHMHEAAWAKEQEISEWFRFTKLKVGINEFQGESETFDLVYFDAFSPETQPEMWTEEVFGKLFLVLKPGGCLVTYSCKGIVKRALRSAGFSIQKLPGPPGKREILRALKPINSL
ncbi:MAG: tRNA (5-methylaminomethyl-2-thiouridine)(34)-methyltransferase MnmD [Bacteroidales bacterium]|nr:tRNA (5-methylaminomethyl-2-thiouridine)(34)-methyltransferase MnmD [Bacteroidales bacterium]